MAPNGSKSVKPFQKKTVGLQMAQNGSKLMALNGLKLLQILEIAWNGPKSDTLFFLNALLKNDKKVPNSAIFFLKWQIWL